MLEKVAGIISRYNMTSPGHRVGVAVSGGADSVCLLYVLRELAAQLGIKLSVVHLNHRLRGEASEEDAQFVRGISTSLDLPFHLETADDLSRIDPNPEQAGRIARRRFFRNLMKGGHADRIATGHTLSDQAETVLYRLIRGSGTAGLSGILPVTEEGIVRPLIAITRAETEQFLRDRNISWRHDHTNDNLEFARNRIRLDILPKLEELNPGLVRTLAHTAAVSQAEEQYWSEQVAVLCRSLFTQRGATLLLRTTDLLTAHPALRRRAIRKAVETVKGDLRGISFLHIEAVVDLAGQNEGHGRLQLPGLDIFRSFDWLRIARPRTESRFELDYEFSVDPPGTFRVPGQDRRICLEYQQFRVTVGQTGYNDLSSLDIDRLTAPLELRNWRPGDQYAPAGGSREKIKSMFQQRRIPIWDRHGWPVLTSAGRIVWARQFGPAGDCVPGPGTRRVLTVCEVPSEFD